MPPEYHYMSAWKKQTNNLLNRKSLKTNLFERIQNDIKFTDNIADHAKWAYNNIYSVPYRHHAKQDDIARYYHGIQHVTRAALYILPLINLYRKHGDQDALNLTEEDVKLLQLAALFHDSAREGEDIDYWDHESGMFLYSYLTQGLGIDKAKAKILAEAMANKDIGPNGYFEIIDSNEQLSSQWNKAKKHQTKNIYQKIIHDADCLDIIRARKVFDAAYLDFYQDIASKNTTALEEMAQLITESRRLITVQGDKYHQTQTLIKKKYEHENVYATTQKDISGPYHLIMQRLGDQLLSEDELKQIQLIDMTPFNADGELTSSNIRAAIREGKVFVRAISHPTAGTTKKPNESVAELEIRKVMRTKGIATQTLKNDRFSKEHNPVRSVSILGYGSGVFSNAGYLMVNPNINSIRQVYKTDSDTGFGKKNNLKSNKVNQEKIKEQLTNVLNKMKLGGDAWEVNNQILHYPELLCNINSYQAIYYTEEDTPSNELYLGVTKPAHALAPLLQALYLRDQYAKNHEKSKQDYINTFGENDGLIIHRERFGVCKNLPIFKYSSVNNYIEATPEEEFTSENIQRMWMKMCTDFMENNIANTRGLDVLDMSPRDIKILSMYGKYGPMKFKHHAGLYEPADELYDNQLKETITHGIKQAQNDLFEKLKQDIPTAFFQLITDSDNQKIMLNNVMRSPALQKAFASPDLAPNIVKGLLLLTQFKIEKIKRAEQLVYSDFYRDSIENFYKKSIDILLSDQTATQKDYQLRQLANKEFKAQHFELRLLADILMVISVIFVLPIGLYRVNNGCSFFFSTHVTERNKDINQRLDSGVNPKQGG